MANVNKRQDGEERSAYDIAETNVRGIINKIQSEQDLKSNKISELMLQFKTKKLDESIADSIIEAFNTPEFLENEAFSYDDIYMTLKEKGYPDAVKKQIWGLANHEMTPEEVATLDDILRNYIADKQAKKNNNLDE